MRFRTVVHGLLLAGVLGLAAACSDLFGPGIPGGTYLLSPLPEEYQGWWAIVERCSSLTAEMSDVQFRVLPGHETSPDHDAAGAYYKRGHQIVLVEELTRDGFLVRHEMLHAVLARNGGGGHPKSFFEGRCGGVVSCGVPCAEEVGGVPGEAHVTPLLEPDDVLVMVEVVPSVVRSPPEEHGCTTIVVEAQNVGSQAAVVTLNRPTDFGWIVDGLGGGSGGGPTPPNDSVLLEPGASRSYAYDCPAQLSTVVPAEYWVVGQWNRVRSEPVRLVVTP